MRDFDGRGAWRREENTVVLHEVQVPDVVPGPFAIMTESTFVPVPLEFAPHVHTVHELVWVRGGTMTVRLDDAVVTVPDGHGLWIPAGTEHAGRTTARAVLSDALFDPERSPVAFTAVTTIEVAPVLAELLTHLERDDLAEASRLRAEAVVFDVLTPSEQQLSLRVPQAERIGPIVAELLQNPTDELSLSEWAARAGVGERTLARLFRAHTGLSFMQWRQALRVHHALSLLSEGCAVQEVAEILGYAQPSTFIAAFKRVMGTTPGAYTAGRDAVGPA